MALYSFVEFRSFDNPTRHILYPIILPDYVFTHTEE